MNIENLTEKQADVLEAQCKDFQEVNPSLKYQRFFMEDKEQEKGETPTVNEQILAKLEHVEATVNHLSRQIKNIFGPHVLINGKFMEIK